MGQPTTKVIRYRGDTYSIKAKLTKDSTPIDFTAGQSTARFSYAKGGVYESIPGVNGTVDGFISFPFPADVNAGSYTYDIQVTDSNGEIRTYVKDVLEITNDITK